MSVISKSQLMETELFGLYKAPIGRAAILDAHVPRTIARAASVMQMRRVCHPDFAIDFYYRWSVP